MMFFYFGTYINYALHNCVQNRLCASTKKS